MKQYLTKFTGRVQGVGFRFTTESIALQMKINGYIKNMYDGSVELCVECSPEEFKLLLETIKSRMGHYIDNTYTQEKETTGKFTDFQLRF